MAKLKLAYPRFRHAPSVICGAGSVRALKDTDDGSTLFLTSAQESVRSVVDAALRKGGGQLTERNSISKPPGEPTSEAVRTAAAAIAERGCGRIVAVGGGSVLDWARLAWAVSADLLDTDSGVIADANERHARDVRFWLVPTTCATGAEAGDVAVYVSDAGSKTALVSPAFLAEQVVLDGRFLDSIPPMHLDALVCDALTHALEACLSIVPLQLGKESAFGALDLILQCYRDREAAGRNDRLMEAGFLGGVAAANCSVGIVHAFAHSIGVDGLPHGLANACALSDGLEFNRETPQMAALLGRLRLPDADALQVLVRPIVSGALASIREYAPIARLDDADYRRELAARMGTDTAIRSNPRRASSDDLVRFVDRVAQSLA